MTLFLTDLPMSRRIAAEPCRVALFSKQQRERVDCGVAGRRERCMTVSPRRRLMSSPMQLDARITQYVWSDRERPVGGRQSCLLAGTNSRRAVP
jgi:hypothetical protein